MLNIKIMSVFNKISFIEPKFARLVMKTFKNAVLRIFNYNYNLVLFEKQPTKTHRQNNFLNN